MKIILICGAPASGKSTLAQRYVEKGYVWLNRDAVGGKVDQLLPKCEAALENRTSVVLDNTFVTAASRKPFVDLARKHSVRIKCIVSNITSEASEYNAVERMFRISGNLLMPEQISKVKHPHVFPPVVLFSYRKRWEAPIEEEGFDTIEWVPFERTENPEYKEKALILDYDGTLRKTKSGAKYPLTSDDVEILPGRKEKLQEYVDAGYRLLGVSNQSGVHKGVLSNGAAKACFERTNELLGHTIDYVYCPHNSFPIACWCRKPRVGLGVQFVERYRLNRSACIFVGDFKTDETFAKRCGFRYRDVNEFFT